MTFLEYSCWQRCCALEGHAAGDEVEHHTPAAAAFAIHVPSVQAPPPALACPWNRVTSTFTGLLHIDPAGQADSVFSLAALGSLIAASQPLHGRRFPWKAGHD